MKKLTSLFGIVLASVSTVACGPELNEEVESSAAIKKNSDTTIVPLDGSACFTNQNNTAVYGSTQARTTSTFRWTVCSGTYYYIHVSTTQSSGRVPSAVRIIDPTGAVTETQFLQNGSFELMQASIPNPVGGDWRAEVDGPSSGKSSYLFFPQLD